MRIKPKKYLGQNFLTDKNIQNKIILSCDFKDTDVVLEIGAGNGSLTGLIADRVKALCALEFDRALAARLQEDFKNNSCVQIIRQDILKFDFKRHFAQEKNKIKVFGNIPYYITTPILEHLLNYKAKISEAYLTVQKEFAQRVVAVPGTKIYGSLSCFIQYYAKPEILLHIKRTCFFPVPRVDSSLLKISFEDKKKELSPKQEVVLFKLIRAAFNQRRKTLRNSIGDFIEREPLEHFLAKHGIGPNARAENISLANFIALAKL